MTSWIMFDPVFVTNVPVFLGNLGYLVALATHRFLEIPAALQVPLDRFLPSSHQPL